MPGSESLACSRNMPPHAPFEVADVHAARREPERHARLIIVGSPASTIVGRPREVAVSGPLLGGRERSHWYAACSRKSISQLPWNAPSPPLDHRPLPDFLAPSAERASSSILMRDSAAANACSATESAGITT